MFGLEVQRDISVKLGLASLACVLVDHLAVDMRAFMLE